MALPSAMVVQYSVLMFQYSTTAVMATLTVMGVREEDMRRYDYPGRIKMISLIVVSLILKLQVSK